MFSSRSVVRLFVLLTAGWVVAVSSSTRAVGQAQQPTPVPSTASAAPASHDAVLRQYCVTCHNQRLRTAGLALDELDVAHPTANPEVWERVVTKLRAGSMPPAGRPRPDAATYDGLAGWLEGEIDRAWAARAESGPHQRRASAEPHAIQQRHPRSVRRSTST